jgi:hypothetical protein
MQTAELSTVNMVVQFFHDVFKDIDDGVVFIKLMDNMKRGQSFKYTPHSVPTFYQIKQNYDGYNMFFTPTVFTQDATSYQKKYAYKTQVLRVDIDHVDQLVLKRLNEYKFKPNYILFTGGGYHAYWLLDKPLDLTSEQNVELYEKVTGLLLEDLHGDLQTKNVNRLMRMPLTYNYKYQPPVEVSIVEYNEGRYNFNLIASSFIKHEITKPLRIDDVWKEELWQIVEPYYIEGRRHLLALYLAGFLYKNDVSFEDAMDIIRYIAQKAGDNEIEDRERCVVYTYQKKTGIKGYSGLREINEALAQRILALVPRKQKEEEILSEENIEEMIMDKLMVLARLSDNKDLIAVVYHKEWQKSLNVSVGKATTALMENLLGTPLSIKEGMKAKQLLSKMAMEAPFVDNTKEYRRGIWKTGRGKYVANLGVAKVVMDSEKKDLTIVKTPVVDGKYYSMEEWLSPELIEYAVYDDVWDSKALFDERVYQHWETVNWEEKWMPLFFHAILTLAFIANHLTVRPLIYILGYSGSGKTWLFEKIADVTQNVVRLENTTFAARMVQLNNNMVIPLFNDFEPTEANMRIIEEWKQATVGNAVITRSSTNHQIKEFTLFHIPIFNSVNYTVTDEAIINRTVMLKLLPLTGEEPRHEMIDWEATTRWIVKSMLYGVLHIPAWQKKGKAILAGFDNIDTRMKNALAPVIGLLVEAGFIDVATEALSYYDKLFESSVSTDTNVLEEYSLEMLVSATVNVKGIQYNILDLLVDAIYNKNINAKQTLKTVGILVDDNGNIYMQLYKIYRALGLSSFLPSPSLLRTFLVSWGAKQADYVKIDYITYKKVYNVNNVFKPFINIAERGEDM